MPQPFSPADTSSGVMRVSEYQTLRDTIRERGSLRVLVFVLGLSAWALAWAWLATSSFLPFISLVPLMLLASVFEAVNALHVGVERIGRYIEVFHESVFDAAAERDRSLRRWETAMTEFARRFPGGSIDPLFSGVFAIAVLLNLVPVAMLRPPTVEWVVLATAHLIALGRVVRARRRAADQRATDLASFQTIYRAWTSTATSAAAAGSVTPASDSSSGASAP